MASFAEIHKNKIVGAHDEIDVSSKELKDMKQTDHSEVYQSEYRKYIRNKLVFDCLQECIRSLENEMKSKVENIVYGVSLRQFLKLGNHNLLGIDLNIKQLSYQEGEVLKLLLQKQICEKRVRLNESFKKITLKDLGQVVEVLKSTSSVNDLSISPKDRTLISFKDKLVKEQEIFMKLVAQRANLWSELLSLRLKKVPNMCIQANRGCKAILESNYLKSKLAEYKTKLDIFMEVPKAIEAYEELLKDIKQQQEECELLIEDMRQNKMKYEDVGGREFDEILKQYLMYVNSLNKLKKMYEFVK